MNPFVIASIAFSLNAAFAALLLFLVAFFAARASRVNRQKSSGLIQGVLIGTAGVLALLLAGPAGLTVVAWAGIFVGCFGLGLFTGTASLSLV